MANRCCRFHVSVQRVAGALAWCVALGGGMDWALPTSAALAQPLSPVQTAESVVLPPSVPDPLEPINRAIWSFNKGILTGVVKPTGKVYRAIVRKRIRTGIANLGRNITYPGRLINNLLEAHWPGARDETYRFACNTVVGAGGFIDVASKWKIPASEADFGRTFGQWGWKPHCFLMLPIFGPSNERDALGFGGDMAANPLTYLTPYDFVLNDPMTYLSPYTYYSYALMYNNLTDSVGEFTRFNEAEMDAYSEIEYAWTFVSAHRTPDFQLKGEQEDTSLQ